MQVSESLLVSRYVTILQLNKIPKERIVKLKKEYIDYIEGQKQEPLSDELNQFLTFIHNEQLEEQENKGKRI